MFWGVEYGEIGQGGGNLALIGFPGAAGTT